MDKEEYPLAELTQRIIRRAIFVHSELGPGLLESIYEEALTMELAEEGLSFLRQVEMPVVYKGVRLGGLYRVDFIVENLVVLELKSVLKMNPVFDAQVLTYMKLGGWKVGLLLNFGQVSLRDGIRRFVL
jgi:GxxExxY protein